MIGETGACGVSTRPHSGVPGARLAFVWFLAFLDEVISAGANSAIGDVYISPRFQGGSFPGGNADNEDWGERDRVFFVGKPR
jgi:hypothetical protein